MLVNINESKNNLQAINEVYFGKTKEILAIEKQLDLVRNKYMNRYLTNIFVNNDPDLLKLNRMIEDYFGFGCFSLNIINEPTINAFTIPIDFRLREGGTGKIKSDLIVNKNTFKFEKSADYTCMVYIYSGVIFNSEFTTGEVMAMILHEIGHNFYSAINNSGTGVMVDLYMSLKIIYDIYLIFVGLISNPSISLTGSIDLLTSTDDYYKLKEKMKKTLRQNNDLIIKLIDIQKWFKSLANTAKLSIINIIDMASLGLLHPVAGVLNTAINLNLLSLLFLPMHYKNERTADNFATIYGYGPDHISLHNKINSLNIKQPSKVKTLYMKIPLISNLYALNVNIGIILFTAFDEHPVGISRCSDQLNMLKRELEKSDIDPKMKKAIQEDIKVCESNIKDIINVSGGLKNKDIIRNAWYKSLYETSDSKDLKDMLLDDINKFNAYDDTYNSKLKGGK